MCEESNLKSFIAHLAISSGVAISISFPVNLKHVFDENLKEGVFIKCKVLGEGPGTEIKVEMGGFECIGRYDLPVLGKGITINEPMKKTDGEWQYKIPQDIQEKIENLRGCRYIVYVAFLEYKKDGNYQYDYFVGEYK